MDYRKEIIISSIENLLNMEQNLIITMTKEYRSHKTGKLITRKRGDKIYYCEKIRGKERGITNNTDRLNRVIRNNHLEEKIASSKSILEILQDTLYKLSKVKETKKLLPCEQQIRANYSVESWEWMKASYDTNMVYPENLQFKTLAGTIVRSKSEWRIASALEEAGIPYRYEQKMYIGGKIVYPDFTILRADGSIVIWEHCGLMDDADYEAKHKTRVERYEDAGFRQHTNFICTYEEDIKSQENIDSIIKRFILL